MVKTVLILVAIAAASGGLWLWRVLAADAASPVRTGLRRRLLRPAGGARGPTIESVCAAAAEQMGAVVMLLKQQHGEIEAAACAPWGVPLGSFDKLAAKEVFDDGVAAGKGSGRHGMSDWLFLPITRGASVVAVAALAGRNCRRSFNPDDDRNVAALIDAFRTVLEGSRPTAPATPGGRQQAA